MVEELRGRRHFPDQLTFAAPRHRHGTPLRKACRITCAAHMAGLRREFQRRAVQAAMFRRTTIG